MKNRIKWRVNIFDIVIIVIVIAAAAAFLIFKDIKSPDDISSGDSTDICYTITFSNMSEGMGELISVG
ncbi:MAG: hypothetical protein HUJ65_02575, partial [Oscillospiraceae bacterium]|nr:hypothetical protein [Oscillospiraceae bacterium]